MRLMKRNRKIVLVLVSLFLLSALPAIASAQSRGRGQDKKLDKFVNGHDARDGRWDGRGPQGTRVGHRNRRGNRIYSSRNWRWGVDRNRNRDSDRDRFLRGRRHNRWDRFERRQMRRQWRRNNFRNR